MKLIPLTQNLFAKVDDEDYDRLIQWKWYAKKCGTVVYAARNRSRKEDKDIYLSNVVYMHREIMRVTGDRKFLDHINHDGLDNRKCNLREINHRTNGMNKRSEQNSTSSYKGVSKMHLKRQNLFYWHVQISINGKNSHIGTYPFTPCGELLAAVEYDNVAQRVNGEFAHLNFR